MDLGKKEGIVVVGEIQKREIMPLTLELIGAAGKLSKERDLSLSVISIRMWDQRRGKEALQLRS